MGWRDKQRAQRNAEMTAKWRDRLRTAWEHLSPQEKIDFLAELEANASTPRAARTFRDLRAREHGFEPWEPVEPTAPPEPENPEYNAAVQHYGGDPLTRAALTHTQLIPVYRAGE